MLLKLIRLANRLDERGLLRESQVVDEEIAQVSSIVNDLNSLLADEYVIYIKLRNYHWNVEGPFFNDLHSFFETEYEATAIIADDIAERVRALNGFALGTMAEFVSNSSIKEFPDLRLDHQMMLADLERSYETMIAKTKEVLSKYNHDLVSQDFLTNIILKHEKTLWKIRSLLN